MKLAVAAVVSVVMLGGARAHADSNLGNVLVGPVVGVRLGGTSVNSRLVLGFEGGGGYGPERFNLGFDHRDGKDFYYVEIDPWYILGGTLGVGIDSDGKTQPVLGLWEGLPLTDTHQCSGWHKELTISGGYRYTGVHELYLSVKAGYMDGDFCFE